MDITANRTLQDPQAKEDRASRFRVTSTHTYHKRSHAKRAPPIRGFNYICYFSSRKGRSLLTLDHTHAPPRATKIALSEVISQNKHRPDVWRKSKRARSHGRTHKGSVLQENHFHDDSGYRIRVTRKVNSKNTGITRRVCSD